MPESANEFKLSKRCQGLSFWVVLSGKVHPMTVMYHFYQLLGKDDWIGRGKKKKAHNAKRKEEKGIMYLSWLIADKNLNLIF